MPTGLKRYQANRDAHFVTFRCYRREARLAEPGAYETFVWVFEQARKRHGLLVYGYVLMPEHVHLLTTEPPMTLLATVLKVAKQESAKKLRGQHRHFWQARYYDFNVFTEDDLLSNA
ncbi:MAG: transposase [Janthinobacterium lividum]